jgi:hypothetical protein
VFDAVSITIWCGGHIIKLMMKLRHREVTIVSQGHTAGDRQSRGWLLRERHGLSLDT